MQIFQKFLLYFAISVKTSRVGITNWWPDRYSPSMDCFKQEYI